jgi:ABC-2 type transport system ATP-binding protein
VSGAQNPSFSRIREEPSLIVDNLGVQYGDLSAVSAVSFQAWAGQVTAVLGPNGAGKTSTIEVCEGIRRPTTGTVRIFGLDPIRDRRILRPQMGIMLQDGGIYPSARPIDTVRQYCGLYKQGPSHADPDELLERVGLSQRRRTPWRRLSGGERQRLSLAMALAARPRIAFLDEPTSGVDVNGRTVIREIIRELADSGSTVIVATHELDEAEKIADRVAIFHHGELMVEGPLDNVRRARRTVLLRTAQPLVWDTLPPDLITWLVETAPATYVMEDAPTDLVATLAVWLNENGIDVVELRTGISTLEDVFKQLTGGR